MPEIKCHLYDITNPDPDVLHSETWIRIQERMQSTKLMGNTGQRYGFVSPVSYKNLVSGFFVMEGQKQVFQYNDDKEPIALPNANSFEHLFFCIFTDTSQILLQHKNIYGYVDLGLPKMRQQFLSVLTDFLRLFNVYVSGERIVIEPAATGFTQEELYQIFISNPSVRIKIEHVGIGNFPGPDDPKYRLYNPKDEWNYVTWGAVAETAKAGTKKVVFEGDEKQINNGINKGPLPKAFAQIGTIEEVEYIGRNGNIVIRKKEGDEEITIELPAEPEISIPVLDLVLSKQDHNDRVETWKIRRQKRKKDEYGGPLFKNG
jgi:hypothetical protein